MAELFEQASVLIQQLVSAIGYPGIFLAALIETVFPPLPAELIMPFSGFQVARGAFDFLGVVIAGTLGAVAGSVPVYYFGVWVDERVFRRLIRRYGRLFGVSEADLDRALRVFRRYGDVAVFVGRLIPLIRTLISIPAGMARMPLPRFLLFTAAGTFIWMAALTYAGMLLGENWEALLDLMRRYEGIMIGLAAIAALGLAAALVLRAPRRRRGPADDD